MLLTPSILKPQLAGRGSAQDGCKDQLHSPEEAKAKDLCSKPALHAESQRLAGSMQNLQNKHSAP